MRFLIMIMLTLIVEAKDIKCDKGYEAYKNITCMNTKYGFIEDAEGLLSCKDLDRNIQSVWKDVKGKKEKRLYLTCDKNLTSVCEEGFNQVNDTCLKTVDNIVIKKNDLVCSNRVLRYEVMLDSKEKALPHYFCVERPHIIEDLLHPSNTSNFIKNTEVLGDALIAIPKSKGVSDIDNVQRGNFIAVTTKKIGIIALSDILYVGPGDEDSYQESVMIIRDFIKYIKLSAVDRYKLKIINIKSVDKTLKGIIDFMSHNVAVYDPKVNAILTNALHAMLKDIKSTLSLIETKDQKEKVLDYILDEYYHIYKLIAIGSGKLER